MCVCVCARVQSLSSLLVTLLMADWRVITSCDDSLGSGVTDLVIELLKNGL